MLGVVRRAAGWVACRPAYSFLAAAEETLCARPAERYRHAWIGLMLLSAAWGLAGAGVFGATWRLFGDLQRLPILSAAVVVAAAVLWLYRRSFLALGEVMGGGPGAGQALAAGVLAGLLWVLMVVLAEWKEDWPTYLPTAWQWVRPKAMYRALILAPIWGGWSMLILPQFCRPGARTEPATAALARGCGPLPAALCMGPPLAASILYFNYLPWTQLSIPAVAVLAAILGGRLICLRTGGLTRTALLATNLLTQFAFLLAAVANNRTP